MLKSVIYDGLCVWYIWNKVPVQRRDSRYTLTAPSLLTPPPPCVADGGEPSTQYAQGRSLENLGKESPKLHCRSITRVVDELGVLGRFQPSERRYRRK